MKMIRYTVTCALAVLCSGAALVPTSSAAPPIISCDPPSLLTAPVESPSGEGVTGRLLSTTNGTWGNPCPAALSYYYQWYRDDSAISGATSQSRTTTSSDLGHAITAKVTACNSGSGGTGGCTTAPRTVRTNYFVMPANGNCNGTYKPPFGYYSYATVSGPNLALGTFSSADLSVYAEDQRGLDTGHIAVWLGANNSNSSAWIQTGILDEGAGLQFYIEYQPAPGYGTYQKIPEGSYTLGTSSTGTITHNSNGDWTAKINGHTVGPLSLGFSGVGMQYDDEVLTQAQGTCYFIDATFANVTQSNLTFGGSDFPFSTWNLGTNSWEAEG